MAIIIHPRLTATLLTGGGTLNPVYTHGLVYALAPCAGYGFTDMVSGLKLSPLADGPFLGTRGRAFGITALVTTAYADVLLPEYLKLTTSITMIMRVTFVGTVPGNLTIFSTKYASSGAAPYVGYGIGTDSGGFIRLGWNNAGTFQEWNGGVSYQRAPTSWPLMPMTIVGLFTASGTTLYFGPDGGSSTATAAVPTYSSTSSLIINANSASNCCIEYGLIYNRRLSPSELKSFRDNPYCWLKPSMTRRWPGSIAAASTETTQFMIIMP